ncbi:MAG TPA: AAA family ATPase, partial [Candidatus Tumulicola sp.]|nr:AAA family ATPase [Candidatus Tumulicola sp.]
MHRRTYGGGAGQKRGPLIGRGREMAELQQTLAAARGGTGGVVVLWGGAGVGKTRLLAEFCAAAQADGASTASAACFEYVRPAFGPFDELFSRLGLPRTGEVQSGPARTAADAAAVKHARFSSAVNRLSQAGASSALALTLDDLQWADLGSLELLSFAAAQLRRTRTLLIAAVRTDDIERDAVRFEMIEKLKRDATAGVEVGPLSDDEMRRLIDDLCGDASLTDSQIARVCALAEGRPYFAQELVVNALRAGDAGDAPAPPSIRSSVLARLAGLSAADRNTTLHAAAIGRRFDAAFLAELLGAPAERVWDALSAARDLQLIVDEGDGTPELSFRHAITREVIYRELLGGQARAIHTRIAQLLAERDCADPTELAYHWKAGGDSARAAASSEAAGDAAFARDAYEDAAAAYRQALGAELDRSQYAALCEKFSRALSICGNVVEALEWSRRAVDGYVEAGDSGKAAACALWLSRREYDAAQSERAIATVQWALDMLEPSPDTAARFDAYMTIASFETLQGRSDAAARHLAVAEALEGGQRPDLRSSFYAIRAMVRAAQHQLRIAFDDYRLALRFARESGIDSYVAWTLNNYASRAIDTGHPAVALPMYDEALTITRQKNLGKIGALASQGYAVAHLLAGRLDEAMDLRRRGLRPASAGILPDSIAAAVALRVAFLTGDAAGLHYLDDGTIERGFDAGETQIVGLLAGCAGALLDVLGRRSEAARLRSRAL